LHRVPNVVVIGGGTGSFTLLNHLKNFDFNITALVNMSDDGGSTGILRDELGVLPPGDVRQCLVALSSSEKLRDLMNYRFDEGSLNGHSFGNLLLSALEKTAGSFSEATELAGEVLRIKGRVLPITTQKVRLVSTSADGSVTKGQFTVAHMDFTGKFRPKISLEPAAEITDEAKEAIQAADAVVIAPGNLYGTLAPALVVGGVGDTMAKTAAKVVYICNLVTKPHQTEGFMAHDYADEIERFLGAPALDYLLYNTDKPSAELLGKYTHDDEHVVEFDTAKLAQQHYEAVGLPLIDKKPIETQANDKIAAVRSLIRHDGERVAEWLQNLLQNSEQ